VEEEKAATEAEKVRRKIIGRVQAGSVSSRQREVTKYLTKFQCLLLLNLLLNQIL